MLLWLGLSSGLRAQDTEFWFVAPHLTHPNHNFPTFLAVSNGTLQPAHLTITLYNGGNPLVTNTTVAPGALYKLDFPTAAAMATIENPLALAGSVAEFGIHIASDVKVTAYYMINSNGAKDIFTLKGSRALGKEFYVPIQSDNAAAAYNGHDQIDLVATEDDTEVTITPKAKFYLATETPHMARADTTITRRLNKGQTLKIREYAYDEYPTLAGTHITSTQPIAVTVTEPVGGDASGDQIVPVNSLGTRYIVPRGYRWLANVERFYLVAAEANTTVNIYATVDSNTHDTQIVLANAGSAARYDFPTPTATDTVFAVYVESDKPVYLYQRSAYAEEGSALLPSIYAIQQTQLSFYQVYPAQTSAQVQKGVLIFRDGAHDGFTVTYGEGGTPSPLALTPLDIPFVDDWKIARFDFDNAPVGGQVIKVQSAKSAFSLGYITGNAVNNNSYGYFSAFGEFEFPAVTWMCGSSVTLQGGYAKGFLWTFPDGVTTATTPSIAATEEGVYKLEMDQDGSTLTASTTVRKISAGSITSAGTTICTGETPDPLSVAGAVYPSAGMTFAFQWQSSYDDATWTDIPGETSSTYAPGPLTRTTWYRWKISADLCADETEPVRIKVSSCTLPVNPHLMIQYK